MCDLVLLPVKAFHLVLLQFFSGFHILVIITLQRKNTQYHHNTIVKMSSELKINTNKNKKLERVSSYCVVFQLALVEVDDVGAHAVEEVLGMGYQN